MTYVCSLAINIQHITPFSAKNPHSNNLTDKIQQLFMKRKGKKTHHDTRLFP